MDFSTEIQCKYCSELEDQQSRPCLQCKECGIYVHRNCLKSLGTPGDFLGDVFFLFTCAECSPTKVEIFMRHKMQWSNVVSLVLFNLMHKSPGISNRGFFHWRTHISSYIDKHWNLLFGKQTKRKKNWMGTVSGILSHFSNVIFISGSHLLAETGWWKLAGSLSPAIIAQMKNKQNSQISLTSIKNKKESFHDPNEAELMSQASGNVLSNNIFDNPSSIFNTDSRDMFDMAFGINDDDSMSDLGPSLLPDLNDSYENVIFGTSIDSLLLPLTKNDEIDNIGVSNIDMRAIEQSADSGNSTCNAPKPIKRQKKLKKIKRIDTSKKVKIENAVVQDKEKIYNDYPWESDEEIEKCNSDSIIPLNEYEELNLLRDINNILLNKLRNSDNKVEGERKQMYALQRMKAKLNLRKLKRHKGLNLFDFDNCVKDLMGFPAGNSNWSGKYQERILDRFQNSRHSLCGTTVNSNSTYGLKLISQWKPTVFRSPYSGRFLKPFIRRDSESKPLWLNLMTDLQLKTNKNNNNFILTTNASIDYCYVQPQHIAAISSLCSQFFWPGVDLTEILQYPDFTCVALYKKLVIGFACLVPDVDFNTAYLTFLFTRPEWRRAGIATFMLYHLLQTCSDKDVILHVSVTNPAVFLYQRFGFKIEEMIQDFYDKYFDITSKECKHALLLRLTR